MGETKESPSVADIFDAVRWDYDPEKQELSPLVSTERYFRDFPWEPEDIFPAEGGGEEKVESQTPA